MAKRLLAVLMLLVLPMSGFAETAEQCSCDPDVKTALLRQRIEAQRGIPANTVEIAFIAPNASFATYFSFPAFRGLSCPYVLDDGVSGLVDIVLHANPVVGYPKSMAGMHPEARIGIFFGVYQPYEFDLWFANPLRADTDQPLVLVGQSHDFWTATAGKVSADGTLQDELLKWAKAHGHPERDPKHCTHSYR